MFYIFALFSLFINNQSLYQSFGFFKEQPIVVGFLLFSDALAPMDAVVKLLMNILSRKFEFEAGMLYPCSMKSGDTNGTRRWFRSRTWILQGACLFSSQVADPEPVHHGCRLDVRQLPLLSPDPVRASPGPWMEGW